MAIHSILLKGTVEASPLRMVRDGKPVAVLRLLTLAAYPDPEGRVREQTDRHQVEIEGDRAYTVWDLEPGDPLVVRGRLAFTTYLGEADATRIVVRAEAVEIRESEATAPAPSNAARITGILASEPIPGLFPEVPVTWLTLVTAPASAEDETPPAWPPCALQIFAVGGMAIEAMRLKRGTRVTLQGHLHTLAGDAALPQAPPVYLAATAWG